MTLIEPPSIIPFDGVIEAGMTYTGYVISCIVLLFLLFSSALISGSEAAFFSLTPTDKEDLEDKSDKKSIRVLNLLDKPRELLATILVTNNFVNIGIVILSNEVLTSLFFNSSINLSLQFFLQVVLITLILLLFGEVIPKIYATKKAAYFAKSMSNPLLILSKLPPVSWIQKSLVVGSRFIQKKAKGRKVDISSDELEQALALTREDSVVEEHKILEGIVKFGNTEVRQIMKSRLDVHAIDITSTFEEVMELILICGHSRIPVFEENFDNIKGVLFIKDLLPFLGEVKINDWKSLIREPFFVTENRKIDDLLKDFQEKKVHIAFVVDEYGGTSGIVTLEDVLEEIVGDITDEFDDEEIVYSKINETTYLFEGKTSLVDFLKIMEIDNDEDFIQKTAETLGGYIIECAGEILKNNEFIETKHFKMIIESSDKKRVKMIKVIKLKV